MREKAEAGALAFGTIDSFIAWRLTSGAAHVTDVSNASRTLLMDLRTCAWDPDLSLKVQREAGLKVLGCRDALVYHEELIDDRKRDDMAIIEADNAKLFAKWNLPAKFSYPDPAPGYQQMLRERALV